MSRKTQQEFIYEFHVEDDIPYSKRMSKSDRISAECNIVQVIYESFVVTADQDYLTARLLARSGLYRAFFWAGAQTLEKYLKAFLLLRGHSVKVGKSRSSHAVGDLYARACNLDVSLQEITVEPHGSLDIPDYVRPHLKVFPIGHFLRDIDEFGRPDNRYNSFGVDFNTGHLYALDHFVFGLREKIRVPDIWQSLRNVDDDVLRALDENNPWFSRTLLRLSESRAEPLALTDSSAVTKLDFLVKQMHHPPYRVALEWLNRKMLLPAELKRCLGGM